MTCYLRRLRRHGLIERIPKSHRYDVTLTGLRIAWFFTRTYARLLRPEKRKNSSPKKRDSITFTISWVRTLVG